MRAAYLVHRFSIARIFYFPSCFKTPLESAAWRGSLAALLVIFSHVALSQTLMPASKPVVDAAALNASDRAGYTPGEFTVDKTGAARYSIPIFAVLGTAGVTPKLSLEYDSGGGNGLLGLGWALGGFSEITRCHQTVAIDGQSRPITWSAEDRYCFDGQRLIDVSGGAGTEFRKEIDDGDIVKAYGAAGSPSYFRVQRKDGSYSFYGDAPTSRDPNATGPLANTFAEEGKMIANRDASKVVTWRLRKYQDAAGNPIWYQSGYDNGHLIKEVRYAYGSNTGPANYGARIYFEYQDRPDAFDKGYIGGFANLDNKKRIFKITVENAGISVRAYSVGYIEQPTDIYSGPSHLNSVQECGLNNVCRPATTFAWQLPKIEFGNAPLMYKRPGYLPDGMGDLNGDACMDAIFLDGAHLSYLLGNCGIDYYNSFNVGSFTDGDTDSKDTFGGLYTTFANVLDLNADGRDDVVVFDNDHKLIYIYYFDIESGKLSAIPEKISSVQIGAPSASDVNGDGIIDFAGPLGVKYGQKRSGNPTRIYEYDTPVISLGSTCTGTPLTSRLLGTL